MLLLASQPLAPSQTCSDSSVAVAPAEVAGTRILVRVGTRTLDVKEEVVVGTRNPAEAEGTRPHHMVLVPVPVAADTLRHIPRPAAVAAHDHSPPEEEEGMTAPPPAQPSTS